jgi:hypothetical protein
VTKKICQCLCAFFRAPFIKGQPYRSASSKKLFYTHKKSGKIKIEPLALDIDVQLPSNRRDVFGRQFITEESKRVSAGAKTITVKALPEKRRKQIIFQCSRCV